jgi:hypothetical protein
MKKYLPITLALAALAIASEPALAQSYNTTTSQHFRASQPNAPAYSNSECTAGCDGGQ